MEDYFHATGCYEKRGEYIDLFMVCKVQQSRTRLDAICSICSAHKKWTITEMKDHLTGKGIGSKLIKFCNPHASPFWNRGLISTSDEEMNQQSAITREALRTHISNGKEQVDEAVCHVIIANSYSFRSLEHPAWANLISALHYHKTEYKMMSRQSYALKSIELSNRLINEDMQIVKQKVNNYGFGLSSDTWKSSKMLSTTVLMLHVGNQSIVIDHSTQPKSRKTSLYYDTFFKEAMKKLDERNIDASLCVSLCVDGAANILTAAQKFCVDQSITAIRCVAHAMNLMLKDMVKRSEIMSNTIDIIGKISRTFRKSELLLGILRDKGIAKPKKPSSTRFGYVFFEISVICDNYMAYRACIFDELVDNLMAERKDKQLTKEIQECREYLSSNDCREDIIYARDWLLPCISVLRLFDSATSIVGFVDQSLEEMKQSMSKVELQMVQSNSRYHAIAGVADAVIECRRLVDFSNSIFFVAYLLNPYFRKGALELWMDPTRNQDGKSQLQQIVRRYIQFFPKEQSTVHILKNVMQSVQQYLMGESESWKTFHSIVDESNDEPDVLWETHGAGYVQPFAVMVLRLRVNESACETYFSERTVTTGLRRHNLSVENEETLTLGKRSQQSLIKRAGLMNSVISSKANSLLQVSSIDMFKSISRTEMSNLEWEQLAAYQESEKERRKTLKLLKFNKIQPSESCDGNNETLESSDEDDEYLESSEDDCREVDSNKRKRQ